MKTATEAPANAAEQTMDYWRKSSQWGLELHEEVFDHWSKLWSGAAPASDDWTKRLQRFQKDLSGTVTDIMGKHRAMMDQQYGACIDAIDESFRMVASKDPEEFRDRCGSLCRKMLDVMKETSEAQLREFQEATSQWIELWRTSL
jgi:hypothetical protein